MAFAAVEPTEKAHTSYDESLSFVSLSWEVVGSERLYVGANLWGVQQSTLCGRRCHLRAPEARVSLTACPATLIVQ